MSKNTELLSKIDIISANSFTLKISCFNHTIRFVKLIRYYFIISHGYLASYYIECREYYYMQQITNTHNFVMCDVFCKFICCCINCDIIVYDLVIIYNNTMWMYLSIRNQLADLEYTEINQNFTCMRLVFEIVHF